MTKLYIFDLDGTLAQRDASDLDPDATRWLQRVRPQQVAIATNQGGVGMRHWMESGGFGEPEKYPTETAVALRLNRIAAQICACTGGTVRVYVAYRYLSKSGNWSPIPAGREDRPEWRADWRKPEPGMLLQALRDFGVAAGDAVFIGDDMEADAGAAMAAGVRFVDVLDFYQSAYDG